ncbi:MAG: GDP-mannose 4,6-dehydratase [Planctomycetota bacterium]|nr:GDP-mannose 4,6-dehydratase [Planctomycetota bacterium]
MEIESPILVTGAAGFIGSHVAEALVVRGCDVVGYDNFDGFYAEARKRSNIAEVERAAAGGGGRFRLVEGDICDAAALEGALRGCGVRGVIHLAARAGVRPSIAQPAAYARTNVEGTTVVLDAAARAGCSRVVAASSSSVYGNNPKVPFAESDAVDHPISPYAATKKACELVGHCQHALTGMPVGMLRFFTVFGPRQRPDLAIAQFLERVSSGKPIRMFGDGSTSRDYTYVDDIVSGVLSAYERVGAHGYRVWNLGGNQPVKLSEMIGVIERVTGRAALIERAEMQAGDVERTYADLSRSAAELGYGPRVSFEEGVRRQWEWMRGVGGVRGA